MTDQNQLPLTAAHWGTYRVLSRNGRVEALYGFEQDKDVSVIGQGLIDTQDDNLRIRTPMVRESWLRNGRGSDPEARGKDRFVPVSWDRAEQLVADEIDHVRKTRGNNAIFAGSYGWSSAGRFHHAQSQIHRFLNCVGGYTRSLNTYSMAAAEVIVPHVIGDYWGPLNDTTSWDSIISDTELFVAFGGIPLKNGQITPGGVGVHTQRDYGRLARDAGVKFVNISPIKSDTDAKLEAQWIAARPNTDTAIMLAIAHTLHSEGLADTAFLTRYTVGFEKFAAYLMGETDGIIKNALWAEEISEIPACEITALARKMAAKRTMISVSWSLTRQDHGEQPYWAAITLAAMLGTIGLPGGGVGFGYCASNNIGDNYNVMRAKSLPQGDNPVADFIPVARITELLENPGQPFDYNGERRNYPDIDLIYWAGGNPFHHHQDLNRLLKAWRKPSTVIVHEWTWNAVAKHADIVLPCTTMLERNDIAVSPYDPYLIAMSQVRDPAGNCRNDYDILSGIARKLGVENAFTQGKTADEWVRDLYDGTREIAREISVDLPDYDTFRREGWHFIGRPEKPRLMLGEFRQDPDASPLTTPSGKIEIYSDTIAGFGYDDCPGHAVWIEPAEWLGNKDKAHPLHLISNQPTRKLHSQLDHSKISRAIKVKEREAVALNPEDGKARGLVDGDIVTVHNNRGRCLAGLVIDKNIRLGVVQMSTGAWFDPETPGSSGSLCKHGNVNVLTLDKGTSRLAQGPIAHTCMVEVTRWEGDVPPLTAYDPPEIVE
jgi:biotin/methionine sulfoxide reductase